DGLCGGSGDGGLGFIGLALEARAQMAGGQFEDVDVGLGEVVLDEVLAPVNVGVVGEEVFDVDAALVEGALAGEVAENGGHAAFESLEVADDGLVATLAHLVPGDLPAWIAGFFDLAVGGGALVRAGD